MPLELPELQPGTRRVGRYGWTPDLPDQRDFAYQAPRPAGVALPAKIDWRANCPPVYDQGQLGSCTANAIAGAIEFDQKKQGVEEFTPSRLFIYYNERVIEHSVPLDNGAQIRDGIKSVAKQGACSEASWPYDDTNKNPAPCPKCKYAIKPPKSCYDEAAKHKIASYQRLVPTLDRLRGCLASGYPFVFGFTVYESFESEQVATSGVLNLPSPSEHVVGGHAVMCVGYDDSAKQFIVRNSWGPKWGQAGYYLMPYDYLTNTNLADDFWTIQTV
jgi:C1A family cysteine protease